MKHVEGSKEGKDEEIKGGYSAIWSMRRKEEWREVKARSVRTGAVLKELREWEQAKEREKYGEQEKIVRDTQWGRE